MSFYPFSISHFVTFVISMPPSKLAVVSLYNYLHVNKEKTNNKKKKVTIMVF